jgi:hypothetical protein
MNAAVQKLVADVRSKVSPKEWRTRVDLAASHRLVVPQGRDDLVCTHITARAPETDHHFLTIRCAPPL